MGPRNGRFHYPMPTRLGQRFFVFIATGGCVGYLPGAPGTAGSVVGLLLWWPLSTRGLPVQIGWLVALFGLGVVSAGQAERWFGVKDHSAIVIDEIVGMCLALFGLPFGAGFVIAGFVLFRALDILKPLPALERLPGGWGVMSDDVAAGILTNIVLQGVRLVWMREGPWASAP